MATTDQYTIRGSLFPVRNCLRFLGGDTDDRINANTAATDAVTRTDANGTFSAWIMVPNTTETALSIVCMGDTDANELINFSLNTGLLTLTIIDGGTAQVTTQEDAITIKPHKWTHVAVVQKASDSGPKIYVNGVKVAATNDVTTDVDEWINTALTGLDNFTIGMAMFNNTTVQEFKGYISDVKYWSKALTAAEIVADMNGASLTDDATYLRNHWDMDGDFLDNGIGADNGTLTGDCVLGQAAEFESRLTFATGIPVVADLVKIALTDNMGMAYVVQQA